MIISSPRIGGSSLGVNSQLHLSCFPPIPHSFMLAQISEVLCRCVLFMLPQFFSYSAVARCKEHNKPTTLKPLCRTRPRKRVHLYGPPRHRNRKEQGSGHTPLATAYTTVCQQVVLSEIHMEILRVPLGYPARRRLSTKAGAIPLYLGPFLRKDLAVETSA